MSGKVFIEAVNASSNGVALPISEHLYLVYRGADGDEFVLRGGPQNDFLPFGKLEIERNIPLSESSDRRGDDSPKDRSSTPLDFGPLSDDQAWGLMVKFAEWIENENFDYQLLAENSNAFVGALLHAAGGVPDDMLPKGVAASEAVGFSSWGSIVDDVAPPEDWILRGTMGRDMLTGLQIDDEILGFAGRDRIMGFEGDDLIRAGGGNDRVQAGQGDDRVIGSAGRDTLRGGGGDDKLIGGIGDDRLFGGAGADLFMFRKQVAGEVDVIVDFKPGKDQLLVEGTAALRDAGDAVELLWGDHVIRLEGVTSAELVGQGFDFY